MNGTLLKYISWILFIFIGIVYLYETSITTDKQSYSKPPNEKTEKIVRWAQEHLPQTGVLHEDSSGFVYLKVDDNYINQLYPLLDQPHYQKPPYFRRKNSPGAHISVFYVNERHQIDKIEEIGQQFSFKIMGLERVPPHSHQFIVLKVNAPELEKLRKKYGFKNLVHNHGFHITIAKKKQHFKPKEKS